MIEQENESRLLVNSGVTGRKKRRDMVLEGVGDLERRDRQEP